MFKKMLLVSSIAASSLCQGAFANGNSLADYQPGFQIGALAGYSKVDFGSEKSNYNVIMNILSQPVYLNVKTKFEQGKFAGKLFLGYSFCPYFDLDLGYTYYYGNKVVITETNILAGLKTETNLGIHAIDLMFKPILPLEKISPALTGWNLYGKVGPAVVIITTSNSNIDELNKSNKLRIRPGYALGIGYNFTDNFGVDFSWSGIYSNVKDKDNEVPSTMLFALGIKYKF